jgi:PAS domain S-box-containing protein
MLRTISSVNELLIRAPEEQHLFEEVCRISVESTGFLAAWIGLADRATGRVKVAAAAGAHDFLDDLDVRWDDGPLAEGPTGTAIREGRTVALRELDDDGRTTLWRDIGRQQGFGSCAATPIRRGGEVTGTLTLYSAEPSAFDTEIVGLVEEMAADIGFALTTIDNRRRERALLAAKEAAEQESRASEVRFRTLIENAPMGIGVSREGMTLYVNPACAKMLGYGSEELVGRPVIDFWSSEIGEQIDRRSRAQSEGLDISSHYEADAVRRDGSRLRAEVSVIPMDLPDGPAVVGFMSDITERIRADAALRESELRFRMFIEKAPLAISLARGATGLYANEKFLELWRYKSNDEVVGRSLLEHWAPHDRPIIAERMRQRALGLPVPPYQRLAQRADGTTFPARLEAVSVELPDGPVTAAFITDETDRSLAEEARRESELRLRQIAEGIDQVVWLADAADSRFLYVSPAFATVYGRAVEELYADPGLRLAAVHPDDAKRVRAAIETTQARGDYDESYRIVRPDGTVRSIRDRAFPIRNADAEVYRIVGVSRDVTHERALLVAKEAAEQASRAKSSFLAHISHEIRTPMNAILGYAQLLLRDDALADAQRRKVEVIQSSGGHLLQVLNDVLEMAKIEAGRASLSPVPFDLRAMLGDVESMFGVLTAMKGVALTVECDPALPQRLEADAGKVKQVVINLLSNAVKFTEREEDRPPRVFHGERRGHTHGSHQGRGHGDRHRRRGGPPPLPGVRAALRRRTDRGNGPRPRNQSQLRAAHGRRCDSGEHARRRERVHLHVPGETRRRRARGKRSSSRSRSHRGGPGPPQDPRRGRRGDQSSPMRRAALAARVRDQGRCQRRRGPRRPRELGPRPRADGPAHAWNGRTRSHAAAPGVGLEDKGRRPHGERTGRRRAGGSRGGCGRLRAQALRGRGPPAANRRAVEPSVRVCDEGRDTFHRHTRSTASPWALEGAAGRPRARAA